MTDDELIALCDHTLEGFHGNSEELRNAIGTLFMCRAFGWKVCKLLYSHPTWAKYQRITGLNFETAFEDETPLSGRFWVWRAWKATGKFWEVASRKLTVTRKTRRYIDPPSSPGQGPAQ
jgi:hypothetical protein